MRWMMALLLMMPAWPTAAQEPPACSAQIEGQAACMAGKLCECRFERGGQLIGRPDRFAWDCGALRPMCPAPPTVAQPAESLPPIGLWLQPQRGPLR